MQKEKEKSGICNIVKMYFKGVISSVFSAFLMCFRLSHGFLRPFKISHNVDLDGNLK